MEKELFDWEQFDVIDEVFYIYYDVTRKLDGKKFDFANLDLNEGILEYGNQNAIEERYKLTFQATKIA